MDLTANTRSMDSYRQFLRVKSLPTYRIVGRRMTFPDEYNDRIGLRKRNGHSTKYEPADYLFDYQRDIAEMAIRKRKFCLFVECGLGKTSIFLEFARHALREMPKRKCALIVSPLMVVKQTMAEATRFYGNTLPIEQVHAANLNEWLAAGKGRLGITNYEALRPEIEAGRLGCLILDESSMLKSHYGKWGPQVHRVGAGARLEAGCNRNPSSQR